MTATFTPGIPHTGQSLGVTRDTIRENFTNYNQLVSIDHVQPNGTVTAKQGEHTKISLAEYGVFPYLIDAGKPQRSFIGSYDASAAGTQLVYQPSVVSIYVPCSPRSMARVSITFPGPVIAFDTNDGPYGPGTKFNAGSVTPIGVGGAFTYTFAQPLASPNYFVFLSLEDPSSSSNLIPPFIDTKTSSSFIVSGQNTVSRKICIMVF